MATKRDSLLAAQGKIGKRITMSAPLLERMGMTTEQYERVTLNALGDSAWTG